MQIKCPLAFNFFSSINSFSCFYASDDGTHVTLCWQKNEHQHIHTVHTIYTTLQRIVVQFANKINISMKDYNKDPRENNNNSWSNYVIMHIYTIPSTTYTTHYTHTHFIILVVIILLYIRFVYCRVISCTLSDWLDGHWTNMREEQGKTD